MGAAISQISGEYRDLVTLSPDMTRDHVIQIAKAKATENAIANEADPNSIRTIEISVEPVPYVGEGGNVVMVYVKVVGDLKHDSEEETVVPELDHSTSTNSELSNQILERKDNPSWPYENEEIFKLDKQFGLPEPTISTYVVNVNTL